MDYAWYEKEAAAIWRRRAGDRPRRRGLEIGRRRQASSTVEALCMCSTVSSIRARHRSSHYIYNRHLAVRLAAARVLELVRLHVPLNSLV